MQRCKTLFALLALLPVAFSVKIDAAVKLTDGDAEVYPAEIDLKVTKGGNAITPGCEEVASCGGKVTCKPVEAGNCGAISSEGITVVNAGKNEKLTITWSTTELVVNGTTESVMPVDAKLKMCFAKESTADRPWRKFNANVGKNKQCVPKAIDTVKWSVGKKEWTVKSMVPRCKAYLRVFALNAEGVHTHFSDSDIFQVNGYDGLEPSITIGGVIMSIVSLSILIGYFTYTVMKKQD